MGDIKRSDESRTVQERILSLKYNLQADLQRTEKIAGNCLKLISASKNVLDKLSEPFLLILLVTHLMKN